MDIIIDLLINYCNIAYRVYNNYTLNLIIVEYF